MALKREALPKTVLPLWVTYRNHPRQIVKTTGNPFFHATPMLQQRLNQSRSVACIKSDSDDREKREREREREREVAKAPERKVKREGQDTTVKTVDQGTEERKRRAKECRTQRC